MKPSKINIDNYEAYLLDRIEGTISAEDASKLELFLNKHPELNDTAAAVNVSEHFQASNDITQNFLMSEYLKKSAPSEEEIDLLIDVMEGNADEATTRNVENWLAEDVILRKHYSALLTTRLVADANVVYKDKASLKRTAPVFRPMAWIAAAMFIGVMLISGAIFYNNVGNKVLPATMIAEVTAVDIPSGSTPKMPSTNGPKGDGAVASMDHADTHLTGQQPVTEIIRSGIPAINKTSGNTSTEYATVNYSSEKPESQDQIVVQEAAILASQTHIGPMPRLVQYSSSGVTSDQITTTLYRFQNGFLERRDPPQPDILAMVGEVVKSRKAMLSRTTETLRSFADAQLAAIDQEGLIGISPEHKADGKLDGFALRIAGIEFTNERY